MDLAEEVHAAIEALRMVSQPGDGVWTGLTEGEAAHIRANLDRTVIAAEQAIQSRAQATRTLI